ncbi:MAG: ABC transporter substrate binding protein [Oryzomonas sp.]|uniref:ABC transporter substrate-binding protein n=1 Tax=Oryzomonas sp. TaxID=2855186 RepID=UPI00283DACD2|nr:ABC transporter substrate binding protein [Oryzomonas sp.]MDR3578704.1 ABC transporter substrate binding protein [Oryzomonas sp.]
MKRRLVLLILALATLLPSLAEAYDVLVLQSRRGAAFENVLNGFRTRYNVSQRTIVLSDYADVDVARIVREDQPLLLLAIGDSAVRSARVVRTTPIIAVMALDNGSQSNLSSIAMFAAPDRFCRLLKKLKVRRAGVLFDPAKTGWYLKLARLAAENAGIRLVERKVSTSRETIPQILSLAGKADALWILPDVTTVTQETIEGFFRFGLEQAIPVVSFTDRHLGLGAAAVIEVNLTEVGHQAGEMAETLLKRGTAPDTTLVFPRGTPLRTNPAVLEKLGHTNLE